MLGVLLGRLLHGLLLGERTTALGAGRLLGGVAPAADDGLGRAGLVQKSSSVLCRIPTTSTSTEALLQSLLHKMKKGENKKTVFIKSD